MKDLDFDELDKAVNSLMKSTPSSSVAESSSSIVPAPAPIKTPSPSTISSTSAPTPVVAKSKDTTTKSPQNLTEKRSGRFMDVMHSSSDMRQSQQRPLPASRQGVSLAPISPNDVLQAPTPLAEGSKHSTDTFDPVISSEKDIKDSPASTTWPDPIDMQKLLKEEATTDTPSVRVADSKNTEVASKKENSPEASLLKNKDEKEPSKFSQSEDPTSPFLADTKVEKRPLGGSSSIPSSVPDPKPETATTPTPSRISTSDSSPKLGEDSNEATTNQIPLPAELGQEITAIEADSSSQHSTKEYSSPATPSIESASFITKQYKEKESSGDTQHAAIYDNNTQPLLHPPKKKSGWGVVILIIALILLGGGGAAVLFFLGII